MATAKGHARAVIRHELCRARLDSNVHAAEWGVPMKGPLIAIVFVISGSALTQVSAQSPQHHSDAPSLEQSATKQLSPRDRRFIQTAATNNLAQINLGWIGMQQGMTDRVRDFAQETANDHAQANDRLEQIATRAGVSLRTQPTDAQRATEDRLWTASGRDF